MSGILGMLRTVAELLVPWAPRVPLSSVEGAEAPCGTAGVEAIKRGRILRGESHARRGSRARAEARHRARGQWHHGCAEGASAPGCERPCALLLQGEAEWPLPTQTIPLSAAEGPPMGQLRFVALTNEFIARSSPLEPQFKDWLRWNKVVLGNKVNTLRTFMHLLSPQKAA